MKITISSYITAKNDKPEDGNVKKYNMIVERGATYNIPNLSEWSLIGALVDELKKAV